MPVTEVSADLSVEIAGPDGEGLTDTSAGPAAGSPSRSTNPGSSPAPATLRWSGPGEGLAARGVSVRVTHDGVHLVTIGAVSAPWWQRRVDRVPADPDRQLAWRVDLVAVAGRGSVRGAAGRGVAASPHDAAARPDVRALPPAPGHDDTHALGCGLPPAGAQEGRHLGVRAPARVLAHRRAHHDRVRPVLRHRAARPRRPARRRRPRRCGRVRRAGWGPGTRVHGALVESPQVLRTGARVDVGAHSLAFFREEYADHGRPYGGREGGEIGHQRSQPPRPSGQEQSTGT